VYFSEMGRISRFNPGASEPSKTVEAVITNLPDNRLHANRHPLSSFIFDGDGALLVNVGAPSDQCIGKQGKPRGEACDESTQGEQAASIRRYAPMSQGRWSQQYTVHATGLRNSIALARHASGTVLQGENSYDFESRLSPFEELNVIEKGRHYGWPYCFDLRSPTPGWKGKAIADCANLAKYTPPALLFPPHASPLGLLWYQGAMFPQLQGRLLVSWHGFRSVGGRIAAFETDAKGVPKRSANAHFAVNGGAPLAYGAKESADAFILTPGWNKLVGVRPQGSPVGLAVAKDGAIWTTDDRAGLVIRIAADQK
jgi:glucose/arabinose dehydrogenase